MSDFILVRMRLFKCKKKRAWKALFLKYSKHFIFMSIINDQLINIK